MSATIRRIMEQARELFGANPKPPWPRFHREVFAVDGLVRQGFPAAEQLAAFEATPEYAELQRMLARLRAADEEFPGGPREPSRVITVRLPQPLHATLKAEAYERRTSLNQLAISKLLVPLVEPAAAPLEPAAA